MNRVPYVIWTPPYQHNSGGIRALHRLSHVLNEKGYETYVTAEGNPEWNERRCESVPGAIDPRIIGIYPEIAFGNPLRVRNRVRWVLNVPGFVGGPDHYEPDELVFVWAKEYLNLPRDRILTVKTLEDELFNEEDVVERDADRFWIGKGRHRGIPLCSITEGMEEITYIWPPERRQLADILKRTRTFYTYDDRTQLSWEALLCGCRVVLLPQNKELALADVAISDDYESQLNNFIRITQEWANGTPGAPDASSTSELLVPGQNLPARLSFDVTCAAAASYGRFPFQVRILMDEEVRCVVDFDAGDQTRPVSLPLAANAAGARVRPECFDRRVTSVRLGNLSLTSEAPPDLKDWLSRAAAADTAGDPAGAETLLRQCLGQHPHASEPYRQLALLLASRQDYPQANDLLVHALALAPSDAAPHNEHGTLRLLQGDLPGAVAAYQRALALDPAMESARANLAACEAYLPWAGHV